MRDVSIAILAGGKSRRMGQNKSFVLLDGKPMIEHVLDQLRLLELPIFIVTNTPEAYVHYGLPLYRDILPDHGALGGIYTALQSSVTPYVLCAACDMPFLNPALLDFILRQRAGYEAVVALMEGKWYVFPGVYSRASLDTFEDFLNRREFHLQTVLNTLRTRPLTLGEIRAHDPHLRSFINLNTPLELAQYAE